MDAATRYREYAAVCERAADHVSEDRSRTTLIALAREWMQLAEEVEQRSPTAKAA